MLRKIKDYINEVRKPRCRYCKEKIDTESHLRWMYRKEYGDGPYPFPVWIQRPFHKWCVPLAKEDGLDIHVLNPKEVAYRKQKKRIEKSKEKFLYDKY